MVELQQASLPAGTTGHLFSHITHAANVSADKSYCFLFWKGHFCTQEKKSPPLPPNVHPLQCILDRQINQLMDYSNSGKKSPLFVSGNDVCKLKAQQKMNEIVKPISNMEASIKKKTKKLTMTACWRKSMWQLHVVIKQWKINLESVWSDGE